MKKSQPSFAVGIAGSAGVLKAFKSLLDSLPADTGMAFIFVTKITPSADSHLIQILAQHTKMKALLVADNMKIEKNYCYLIPARADIAIENHRFSVTTPRTSQNNQIDLLFISLAENYKNQAIGIVLSGHNSDGTEGCKRIKSVGGKTFAQDASAEVTSMPKSAVAAGCIDFVLPVNKIAAKLGKLVGAVEHQLHPTP